MSTIFFDDHEAIAQEIQLLEYWVERTRRIRGQPGLSMGVVYAGQLVWRKGFGYSNLQAETPATPETRYRIGSVTKSFTSTAIMQLYENGKLRLDDPVKKYLPWFDISYHNTLPITIYQVLTHIAGLPLDATVPHWTENQFQTWEEIVATSTGRRALFPPNTKWKYSNYGYALLGGIIEGVSGQSFAEYIENHILVPLDMKATQVNPINDDTQRAVGYLGQPVDNDWRIAPFTEAKGYTSAFGMASTVEDLARFAIVHLSETDTPILRSSTLREIHRVHWLEPHWLSGSGLGFVVSRSEEQTFNSVLGEVKGYTGLLVLCHAEQYGIIVLTNAVFSEPFVYALLAKNHLISALQQNIDNTVPLVWSAYTGIYTTEWGGDTQVMVRNGQLHIVDLVSSDSPPTILTPTEEPHIFSIDEGYWSGETCRFELDETEKVKRMWLGSDYSIPKSNY